MEAIMQYIQQSRVATDWLSSFLVPPHKLCLSSSHPIILHAYATIFYTECFDNASQEHNIPNPNIFNSKLVSICL